MILVAWIAMGPCRWSSLAAIPPRPGDREFFHDLAGVIPPDQAREIEVVQQDVFQQSRVPIVVVTVERMRAYDPDSPSIESFARRWFDAWGIGSKTQNDGMLVLVSTGDRKARIELGAAWGGRFDRFCQELMNRHMVPEFKDGKYGHGVVAAVHRLAEIAMAGPQAQPPPPSLTERIANHPIMEFNRQHNPVAERFGPGAIGWMLIAGTASLVAAFFLPQYRKPLLILGGGLIAFALFFWIVALVLGVFARGRRRAGSGFGGFGGGGFGGGSSGGGGASGSW